MIYFITITDIYGHKKAGKSGISVFAGMNSLS
jgi:hypothetical protein